MGMVAPRLHPNVGVAAPRAPLLKFLKITRVPVYSNFSASLGAVSLVVMRTYHKFIPFVVLESTLSKKRKVFHSLLTLF